MLGLSSVLKLLKIAEYSRNYYLSILLIEAMPIYLAEDDDDDRLLFQEALRDINQDAEFVISHDGVQLMQTLDSRVPPPPRVLFLDLNMPRKNGYECLREIRKTEKLKNIPVVIFSTSKSEESIEETYRDGANHYLFKPDDFNKLKAAILQVLAIDWNTVVRSEDNYVLQ
jgi:CheY-like chemotaxis protein